MGQTTSVATRAACTSPLLVDNFSQWSSNTNSLGSWTSDDGTMASTSAANNVLTFTPSSGSYFYETFECVETTSDGYSALSFDIKGASSGSAILEIQTKSSCSASSYDSHWFQFNDISTSFQTISIPLSAATFPGANLDAVTAFVWSTFSNVGVEYQIKNLQFVCGSEPPSSSTTSQATSVSTSTAVPTTTPVTCSNLLVDDWESQSRLTFLYYNALILPSSDDFTMESLVVSSDNRLTITPADTGSYFYSKTGCVDTVNMYGGISLRINAPAGTSFGVQLGSSSACNGEDSELGYQSTEQLGWTFDGTEKLYSIPLSNFPTVDASTISTVLFYGFSQAITVGPMSFYCGDTPSEYELPVDTSPAEPSTTVPAPAGTAAAYVIDNFASSATNANGFWHGGDDGMSLTYGNNQLTIQSTDPDYSFYTQVSYSCVDMTQYDGSYLHIAYTGSNKFTIALQQHNAQCNQAIAPFPETWDSLEAARYASATDIYIPMSHFNIERSRVVSLALKGFYTSDPVTLTRIEIVPSVPQDFQIPSKLPSGNLVFACKRPNSFAFAIDDGDPSFAQEVMDVIRDEGIKVTFFTVGAPLLDATTNLTNVYNAMLEEGHQVALHTFTHPKMEGLPDNDAIDWEYERDIEAVKDSFDGLTTDYFRPPFGNEGARMRQRLAATTGSNSPYIVNWSVDVEDWLWATSATPEKQLEAFQRDVDKGGNLVVMHYLYSSTVSYLRQFIQIAKATGKDLMRVDQCMEDPSAPAL